MGESQGGVVGQLARTAGAGCAPVGQRRRRCRAGGFACRDLGGRAQQHRGIVTEHRVGQLGLSGSPVADPGDGRFKGRGGGRRQRAQTADVALAGQCAQWCVAAQLRRQRSGFCLDPAAFHDHAHPGQAGSRAGMFQCRCGDAGVDHPQRGEDPALVNPIPQQPNPDFEAGVRQQSQLFGVQVFGRRGGTVGLRVAPESGATG